jgi:hypothetical protein
MKISSLSSTFHQLTPAQLDDEINQITQDMQANPQDAEIDQKMIEVLALQKDMIENPQNQESDQKQINALQQQILTLMKENPHLMDGKDFHSRV